VSSLADRQAALVAALVAGAPDPAGIAAGRLHAAREALLIKRADGVARVWPELTAVYGERWAQVFGAWGRVRVPAGSLRDGWDLARELRGHLPPAALLELATREAAMRYDSSSAPRPRRLPAMRWVRGGVVFQIGGRVVVRNRRGTRRV
jgi:hypothetical protein